MPDIIKLDDVSFLKTTTVIETVSIQDLISQRQDLFSDMKKLQDEIDNIDSQLSQANDAGVASAATAIQTIQEKTDDLSADRAGQ